MDRNPDRAATIEGRTKTGLAQATAKASEPAAKLPGGAIFQRTPAIRDLAASAARIFGWYTEKPGVQFNQLAVTQEQLEQIRTLRDNPYKKPVSEGDSA